MFKGIGISSEFALSKAYVLEKEEINFEIQSILSVEAELVRYNKALHIFTQNTCALARSVWQSAGKKESMILEGHIIMAENPDIAIAVVSAIEGGKTAEAALRAAYEAFAGIFESMEDEIMSQRAHDLRDISRRLIEILAGKTSRDIRNISEECVLICRDLTPSDISSMDKSKVKGIVTEVGGINSHSAIIARAMGMPMVLCEGITGNIKNGDMVAVNGISGDIIVNPEGEQLQIFKKLMTEFDTNEKELVQFKDKPSITLDGHAVDILANISGLDDLDEVLENTAEGIGLFRSEFLFMNRDSAPDEEEQFEVYRKSVKSMEGRPVTIRTLDIGGDKNVPYLNMEKEENPFLGLRGIRLCLGNLEMFAVQLRALLRASFYGNIKIMLPMVSTLSELRQVKELIERLKSELNTDGKPFNENIEIGIMIETSAACMISDLLAKECDFFSIGTNDLAQYIMAADRGDKRVQYLYSVFDPAVIRSIHHVIKAGKAAGIGVGICGEGAADGIMIPFLIAAGVDELSMSASSILQVRKIICSLNKRELEEKLEKILLLETKEEVFEYLKNLAI